MMPLAKAMRQTVHSPSVRAAMSHISQCVPHCFMMWSARPCHLHFAGGRVYASWAMAAIARGTRVTKELVESIIVRAGGGDDAERAHPAAARSAWKIEPFADSRHMLASSPCLIIA